MVWAQPDQSTYFQHRSFGIEDNLGHSYFSGTAECVQDDLGFYWLSGKSGLYRFDGNKFDFYHKSIFNLTGSGYLQHNTDVAGNSWIYEKEPIQVDSIVPVMINLRTKEVTRPSFFVVGSAPREEKKYFSGISQGNNHLYSWDSENNIYEIIGDSLFFKGNIPNEHLIRNINWVDENEYIIVSTEDRLCFRRFSGTNKFHKIELPVLVIDGIAGASGIILKTIEQDENIDKQSIYYLDFCTDSLHNLGFSAVNGELWILGGNSTDEWVIRKSENIYFLRDSGDGDIKEYDVQSTQKLFDNNQEPNEVSILKNQYWFFFGGSIELIQFNTKQFTSHLIENKKVSVRSMQCIGDSVVLLNTYRGLRMLDISTLEKDSTFDIPGLNQGGYGFAVGKNGHLYSGLHGRAILHFDPFEQRAERIPFREQDNSHESGALIPFVDSTGKVWVGLESGLGYVDTVDNSLHYVDKEPLSEITHVTFNGVSPAFNPDFFWLSTSKGAFQFDPYGERITESIPKFRDQEITMVRQFSADSIWVIPATGPVYLWHKKNNTWDSLNIFKEEWKNNIHDIIPDKKGFLWFPSNNGLIRYDPFKKDFIRLNTKTDGLPFDEFNKLASLTLPSGRLLLGGTGGAISIDPERFSLKVHNGNESNYQVRVAKIITISNGSDNKLYFPTTQNEVIPIKSSVEQLVIDFAYLNPFHPPCKYLYRIRGGNWFESDEPQVVLGELGYKTMPVELKVVELGTDRFLGKTKVSFKKEKPWYLWNTFMFIYFSIILALIYLFISFRIRRITARNKQLEYLISQRTEELTKDRAVIRDQRDNLNQLTKTQQRLFSIVGHELKNSLLITVNLRQTIAYLLEENRFNDLDKVAIQLRQQALETGTILEQLLQWGKMAIYDIPPKVSSFSLVQLVSEVLKSMNNNLTDKNLIIDCNIPRETLVTFDREAMKIILRNFIHNAIKFSPDGSTIKIRYSNLSSEHLVSIADEGAGIKEDELKSWAAGVGLPLKSGSKGEKGTGLGLMICEKLAGKSGGRINLSARKGNGTVAKIRWH